MTKSTFTIENQAKFCSNCSTKLIKHGKTKNGNQRYKCKNFQKTSVEFYHYNAYLSTINSNIIQLTKEGLGIRSTAHYLQISPTTLLKRLLEIASKIIPSKLTIEDQEFQIDELRTFHKKRLKPIWITYTFSLQTRKIHTFHVGYRTIEIFKKLLNPIIQTKPTKSYTDKLNTYRLVIPSALHSTRFRSTNYIERNHLNLRTHL
ncbi:IS1 family transposase [Empedobacter falsenii]|uniref:IS1 family transposase n=1 Tax=Empedobacter falsenii TaxID=343874 RepID=A0ABY8V9K0_9FLAO|nr:MULTISPECIES: IS1 family transposase [Empedobacter]MCA4775784.1 IS1 family transposase [Empedobacter stercoris]MCA4809527.1 IS1 family transposase [Empedobacter stercoris]QNT13452.1 IS1 family transposase [Empedobacter stercoris]WIH98301.1 IS1 family transposase [Empedobacter falsenii]